MNKNKEVNEVFAKKLEELIIKEVEGVVEKLKGLNILDATVKLTSDELYELIKRNIDGSDDFILTVDLNSYNEIKVSYYYKNKKIQAVTKEENTGTIDVLTLLQLCVLQQTNMPVVEFELYECGKYGLKTCNRDEMDELKNILNCKSKCCEECEHYKNEYVNLFKNN